VPKPVAQVPSIIVGARLNQFFQVWEELGAERWVVDVLKNGYHIPFVNKVSLTLNSSGPVAYQPGSIKAKALTIEIEQLVIKGAVEPADVTPGFYSLLFVTPKASGGWRPILDLSLLNLSVAKTKFKMETIASITKSLRPGMWATSLDLKDAYFHVPIAKKSRKYLRFSSPGGNFQFKALPFGLTTAPAVFTRVIKVVGKLAHIEGIVLFQYLDDWLIVHKNPQVLKVHTVWLCQLAARLGLVINQEKSEMVPVQQIQYLGVRLDLITGFMFPSQDRILKLLQILRRALARRSLPAIQWQIILGHMTSLEKLVPGARLRMRSLQFNLATEWDQQYQAPQKLIPISQEVFQDLNWWLMEKNLNRGVSLSPILNQLRLYSDASLKGWGAHMKNSSIKGTWSQSQKLLHINHLELLAVWLALKHFEPEIRGRSVLVMTDNSAVVGQIQNQGGTKSRSLTQLSTEMLLWAEKANIVVQVKHVPGQLNVLADLLSRKDQVLPTEWSLHPEVALKIWKLWGKPHIDLFATHLNAKCVTFVAPVHLPGAWDIDAMSMNWEGMWAYAYPPTPLLSKVIQKILSENCLIVLIAPFWPAQSWFPSLVNLAIDHPRKLPQFGNKLLKQPHINKYHQALETLQLHAWLLCRKQYRKEAFPKQWLSEWVQAKGRGQTSCMRVDGSSGGSGVFREDGIHVTPLPLI